MCGTKKLSHPKLSHSGGDSAESLIEMPLADHTRAVQHLVLERLNHPGDSESMDSSERGYDWPAGETTSGANNLV